MARSLRIRPHPNPPPQAQGNRIWVNKYESLTERTESKSSEIPVLFTHMRLPCPQAGEGTHRVCCALCASTRPKHALKDLVFHRDSMRRKVLRSGDEPVERDGPCQRACVLFTLESQHSP